MHPFPPNTINKGTKSIQVEERALREAHISLTKMPIQKEGVNQFALNTPLQRGVLLREGRVH